LVPTTDASLIKMIRHLPLNESKDVTIPFASLRKPLAGRDREDYSSNKTDGQVSMVVAKQLQAKDETSDKDEDFWHLEKMTFGVLYLQLSAPLITFFVPQMQPQLLMKASLQISV
jgi:hypothetical protein